MLPTETPDGSQDINKNVRSILIGKIRTSQITHLHSITEFKKRQRTCTKKCKRYFLEVFFRFCNSS